MTGALFCFGLGYSAEAAVREFGARYASIAGTVRGAEKAAKIAAEGFGGRAADVRLFDGDRARPDLAPLLEQTTDLLVSIAPDAAGDPVLAHYAAAIARSPIRSIVYLSTIGVYGDHGGAWIDETAAVNPSAARNRARIEAEAAWRRLADTSGKPLAVLRLAGIYGPGQNAITALKRGQARRIVKPGQVFNRIHVDDIATAIAAAFAKRANGVYNVTDNEPAPADVVVAHAASLLGVPPPPEIPFAEAAKTMTPMALSFYGEVKRARNTKLVEDLGVALRHPTYREGLRALLRAEDVQNSDTA